MCERMPKSLTLETGADLVRERQCLRWTVVDDEKESKTPKLVAWGFAGEESSLRPTKQMLRDMYEMELPEKPVHSRARPGATWGRGLWV